MSAGYTTVGCGPHFEGIIYFYSYFLIMSLVLLKLFIAIILEAYDDIKKQEKKLFNEDKLETFNLSWQRYDPDVSVFFSSLTPYFRRLASLRFKTYEIY